MNIPSSQARQTPMTTAASRTPNAAQAAGTKPMAGPTVSGASSVGQSNSIAQAKPVDVKPADPKPADMKPAGLKPSGDMAKGAAAKEPTALERLAAFGGALMERVDAAAKDAPMSEAKAFQGVRADIESGLARLHHGLSNGSLTPEDVQRGTQNMFSAARESLQMARKLADTGPHTGATQIKPTAVDAPIATAAPGMQAPVAPAAPAATAPAADATDPVIDAMSASDLAAKLAELEAEMTSALFAGIDDGSSSMGSMQPARSGAIYGAQSNLQDLDVNLSAGFDVAG